MCGIGFGKTRVLLVDSDDAYRSLLARGLRVAGLDVVDVGSALEALDVLDLDPGIKMAVVDLRTPPGTLTGGGFARMMRHRNPEALVVLTATSHDGHNAFEESEGFGEILLKAPDADAMAARVLGRLGLRADQPRG
jgi:DNA-binding NtrC family response regulator